ncbi:MAG: hypothetical protein ACOCM4_05540 [Acetivibrio ethanolgignens]
MKEFTTREKLESNLYGCLNSAVLDYGDHIIATWEHCFEGIIVEVYEMIETPEETGFGRCECRLSLIERKVGIEDTGHAVLWAIEQLSK